MKRPWMPFYVTDFQLDTLDLKVDEVGVYFTLICLAWRRGDGGVTSDQDVLKRTLQRLIADFHGHTFNRIVPKLLDRYFVLYDGIWYQKRVVNELQKADKLSAKQSQTANKRWHSSNKNKDLDYATAMPSTTTVTVTTQKKEPKKVLSMPIDFVPDFEVARKQGWSPEREQAEFHRFRDHALANGKRYKDWQAAWRNWVTSPYQQTLKHGAGNGTGNALMDAFDRIIAHTEGGEGEANPPMRDITPAGDQGG